MISWFPTSIARPGRTDVISQRFHLRIRHRTKRRPANDTTPDLTRYKIDRDDQWTPLTLYIFHPTCLFTFPIDVDRDPELRPVLDLPHTSLLFALAAPSYRPSCFTSGKWRKLADKVVRLDGMDLDDSSYISGYLSSNHVRLHSTSCELNTDQITSGYAQVWTIFSSTSHGLPDIYPTLTPISHIPSHCLPRSTVNVQFDNNAGSGRFGHTIQPFPPTRRHHVALPSSPLCLRALPHLVSLLTVTSTTTFITITTLPLPIPILCLPATVSA